MIVAVLVGGDLARSTRSVNVARVLASRGARVRLAGYVDTPFCLAGIELLAVPSFERLRALRFVRQVALAFAWWRTLRRIAADLIIVQNPPAFPILLLARGTIIIDWHNTTAAMLRLRGSSWIARVVERFEFSIARRAAGHLAVSEALRTHLAQHGIDAITVYDAPFGHESSARRENGIVVVPSSWSDDDDFDLLQEFARIWDGRSLRVILTGRGPRRERTHFENTPHVTFEKRWYEPDEYLAALAAADAGLSLHRGTLDLPMKLVEMLACGLPVLALDYGPVLRERYIDGTGVRFFRNARELKELLLDTKALDALRASAHDAVPRTWETEWSEHAEPLLRRVATRS